MPLPHQLDACVDEAGAGPLASCAMLPQEVMVKISTEPAHQQMFTIMFSLESMEGRPGCRHGREHMHLQSMNFFRDLEITPGQCRTPRPTAPGAGSAPRHHPCCTAPWTATSSTGCTSRIASI